MLSVLRHIGDIRWQKCILERFPGRQYTSYDSQSVVPGRLWTSLDSLYDVPGRQRASLDSPYVVPRRQYTSLDSPYVVPKYFVYSTSLEQQHKNWLDPVNLPVPGNELLSGSELCWAAWSAVAERYLWKIEINYPLNN